MTAASGGRGDYLTEVRGQRETCAVCRVILLSPTYALHAKGRDTTDGLKPKFIHVCIKEKKRSKRKRTYLGADPGIFRIRVGGRANVAILWWLSGNFTF